MRSWPVVHPARAEASFVSDARAGASLIPKKFIGGFFMSVCLSFVLCVSLLAPSIMQTSQKSRSSSMVREPNLHAPDLYADRIDFEAALIDLPGAKLKQSYWELSYQLYFVPEDKYYGMVQNVARGSSNPTPEEFPGRILLAEGHKRKAASGTLEDRLITLASVPLKKKVPEAQRTKFAKLLTGYSLKIFDAQLKTTIYFSGIFLTDPFELDPQNPDHAIARRKLYVNFSVSRDGSLNRSQMPTHTSILNRRVH